MLYLPTSIRSKKVGPQFFRHECYAVVKKQGKPAPLIEGKRGPKSEKNFSAREIVNEALRIDEACPHVSNAKPPTVLFGLTPEQMINRVSQLEQWASSIYVDFKGGKRKQRIDSPILLAVVASFPGNLSDNEEEYQRWAKLTVSFLQDLYGDRLRMIVEHRDEEFRHLHAFVDDDGRSVKPLHAGHAEVLKISSSQITSKKSVAYKVGCARLQDRYFLEVGIRAGLERFGPRRKRQPRDAILAIRRENKLRAAQLKDMEEEKVRQERRKRELDDQEAQNEAVQRALEMRAMELKNWRADLHVAALALKKQREDMRLKKMQQAQSEQDLKYEAERNESTRIRLQEIEGKARASSIIIEEFFMRLSDELPRLELTDTQRSLLTPLITQFRTAQEGIKPTQSNGCAVPQPHSSTAIPVAKTKGPKP
jgi:hypothetical protein